MRDAFLAVPRELFLADFTLAEGLEAVYENLAIITKSTSAGMALSSSSQPSIMAPMLERLDLRPGQRVLEIGAGTGYNAALLSTIVGREGRVTSVEVDPEIADRAGSALAEGGYEARVVTGDGREGWEADAPFDRIVATASSPHVPRAWLEQLVPGGLVELPLVLNPSLAVQAIPTLRRNGGVFESVDVLCGAFMPLHDGNAAFVPPPSLNASEYLDGNARMLAALHGACLATIGARARRQLAAHMLGTPRRKSLGIRAQVQHLALFHALAAPEDRVISYGARFHPSAPPTPGLVDRDGRGFAVLGGSGQSATRIDHYGDGHSGDDLRAIVDDWLRLDRPEERNLTLRVDFGRRARRGSWRTLRRNGSNLTFDWKRA